MKIILIHGNCGASISSQWFPWLKIQLESIGIEVIARDFPDRIFGRMRYWLPFLKDEIKPNEHSILIGHSSGGLVSLKYTELNRVLGTVLIATQLTDCGYKVERQSGFFDKQYRWDSIKQNQRWIIQFHSQDDPWVPVSEGRKIHSLLNSEYHEMIDKKHFGNNQYPMTEFPELLDVIKKKLMGYHLDSGTPII